jgi:hypothetical protein
MPSGWTRWLLERFDFPFNVVYDAELQAGSLRDKYDVGFTIDGPRGPRYVAKLGAVFAPLNARSRTARAA